MSATEKLPIDQVLPQIQQALRERDEAIVVAQPGAGKTTRVPLVLLEEPWLAKQQILLLEPRRLAAKLAAQRMADSLAENVGETVGYRMRLESRVSRQTRIVVITEGVLTRMLQSDPSLEGVGLVIFDEFHERSLDADLGLALSLYARSLFREALPLKLLLMSATLDSDALSAYLGNDRGSAPVVRSEGRSFPVDVRYGRRIERRDLVASMAAQIRQCLAAEEGSVLAFLPGQGEIRALADALNSDLPESVMMAPLYGSLSLAEQQRAIQPAPPGQRKVVLATNIAESSLTIEGITVVVDGGWARKAVFDPRRAMTRLDSQRISRASAEQRAGRAGRLAPGVAYRLWSEEQHGQLPAFDSPEIQNADLAPVALQLLQWGVAIDDLHWLETPARGAWQQALELLRALGACDEADTITPHGEAMAGLPAHPRLAHMLLRAAELGLVETASDIAALLSERDPQPQAGADLARRLPLSTQRGGALLSSLRQQARQFREILKSQTAITECRAQRGAAEGLCIALAYPDRVARQRSAGGNEYLLANGRGAQLPEGDSLCKHEWLAIAQAGGGSGRASDRIFLAAPLDSRWFGDALPAAEVVDIIEWQDDGQLRLEKQHRIGALILKRERGKALDEASLKQALLDWLRTAGLDRLPWTDAARQWQARVMTLRGVDLEEGGESEWPDVSDSRLLESLDDWLLPFLPAATHRRQLQSLNLLGALQSLLVWPQPQTLDEWAPTHLTVATGSRVAIDYCQNPPVMAVKLQEMFGQRGSPTLARGRLPVMLHLLSPAGRPLQVTRDLESFWRNAYQDVKKDMKGRYPKHPWPDDPLTAPPKRGTKKQGY